MGKFLVLMIMPCAWVESKGTPQAAYRSSPRRVLIVGGHLPHL